MALPLSRNYNLACFFGGEPIAMYALRDVCVNVQKIFFPAPNIVDPKKATLDESDYQSAISWASQTALRDVIGKTMRSDMLEGKDK